MTLTVHLFARARDLAGTDALSVEVADGATVADLRTAIMRTRPALQNLLPRCAVAVDENFAGDTARLSISSEIAIIPPVSGGSG